MPRIVAVSHTPDDATRAPVAAERLVEGSPLQAVANAYSTHDAKFHCGVWEGGAGVWRVHYTEHEFCHLLSGRVRLRGDDGSEILLEAGQSFVVPAGFTGTWEVLETARKLYAIYEPGD
ncbi:cupin domain-containing protein [Pseudoxanthomonas sp. SE1]|uniref:cupin domain-containing protein n=1 Tax=Pseudoxanthomonas sp. SE1 TaxID=1664560 RepID=UPI00240DF81D|nr:cupin domain-containing protein [Pseudoxanthomonas sp. SE1]WFC42992.1 cupin domain-containing protein [Pseudoxanthomonas sp. SE1]